MYIILGGDGKEYGPVSVEQIKEWLKQRRVDENTQIKQEGETEWKKVEDFPELTPPAVPPVMRANVSGPDDYDIDIGGCFKRGWALVISNPVLTIVGAVFISLASLALNIPSWIGNAMTQVGSDGGVGLKIIASLLGLVSGILSMLFQGVFYAGFYYFILRIMRGETPAVLDVFGGFKRNFVQLMLGGVVMSLLIGLGLILCILPGIYLGVSYIFALPLIIDKEMGFWDAMELSRQTVGKHFFWVLLFLIAVIFVTLLGLIGCIVGIFFTIPIAAAALLYAYEDIFSKS